MSKVPCGGFELDESLALKDGKLGLAPGAGGSQADWNVTDSSDPAFIKNKPFGEIPGVQVFSSYSPSSVETNEDGNQVFTFTSGNYLEILGPLATLKVPGKTYENIKVTTTHVSSNTWTITFDTTGLPITVMVNSGDKGGTTAVVTSLDGSYIQYITIEDMGRHSKKKIDAQYLPDQVQSDWNENDSSDPAFILNKPEIPNGVTWFSASGTQGNMVIKRGEDWNNGTTVYGQALINAFKNGICRCNVTITSCDIACESIGTITGCREFTTSSSHKVGVAIACYINRSGGDVAEPITVEASVLND